MDEQLRTQDAVAQKLKQLRHERGALELETIEPRAVFDGDIVVDLRVERINRARQLIEDFMIAANGVTARFLAERKFPSLRRVVRSPERWQRIVAVAKEHFGAVHNGVFDNPKLRVLVEDGMKFVRDTHEKFDLVAMDLNDPVGPAAALYSAEFLQQIRATLAPGGALTLHLGSPVAQPARVAELAQRLNGLFRIVRVYTMYIPLYGSLWAMAVCSDKLDPKAFTADEIDRRIDARKLQELRYYNGETHEGVFALPNFVRDLVTPARLKQPTRGRRLGVVRAAVK
jgi:predicted membrane-bound spermidine synthase